jgi:endonuclease/exonuclease/phosphatase family metal-dependent hydrolase
MIAQVITRQLTFLTYNIHSGVGVDKRYDLAHLPRTEG